MSRLCRFCGAPLATSLVDLGLSPISNAYPRAHSEAPETLLPLHARVCSDCFLVQLPALVGTAALFPADYAYLSSYSSSWLDHARRYAEAMIERRALSHGSLVIEVASNDGYLLRWFKAVGIPVLGIEPAENAATAARRDHGVTTETLFFGRQTADEIVARYGRADLMVANNVLAHVPDINDFVAGFKVVLSSGGLATFEFPHLLNLIREGQFDTIYHEHFSYLSLATAMRIFEAHGLAVIDVETLPTHGGSLRLHVVHGEDAPPSTARVRAVLEEERASGLDQLSGYAGFSERAVAIKHALLRFLLDASSQGKAVVGYGAPAKASTLLNYAGARVDLLPFTVDLSPWKVGRRIPGTAIPILSVDALVDRRPDYVLILPWNLQNEIMEQMAHVRNWGGRFVTAMPTLTIHS